MQRLFTENLHVAIIIYSSFTPGASVVNVTDFPIRF